MYKEKVVQDLRLNERRTQWTCSIHNMQKGFDPTHPPTHPPQPAPFWGHLCSIPQWVISDVQPLVKSSFWETK